MLASGYLSSRHSDNEISMSTSANKVTLVSAVPGSSVPWQVLELFLGQAALQPSSVTILNPHGLESLASVSHLAGAAGLVSAAADRVHNREAFSAFAKLLEPGATLFVYSASAVASTNEDIAKDLLLSGFTNSKVEVHSSALVLVQATKPTWNVGAKSLLRKQAPAAATQEPAKTWAISAEADDELIDDEDLLTEEDKAPVGPIKVAEDCSVSKKACKNCSCGRAEAEEKQATTKLTADMLENPQSACGSCYLGDAFRCASCPYKGLPAFEAGKKIELSQDLLMADA